MPVIKFEKFARKCGHNERLKPGEKAICDYKVLIDGEHRLTWVANYHKKGYALYSLNKVGIKRRPDEYDNYINIMRADGKDDFLPVIGGLLNEGRIPTIAESLAEAEQIAADKRQKIADELARLNALYLKEAAPALQEALLRIVEGVGPRHAQRLASSALKMVKVLSELPADNSVLVQNS